MDYDIVRFVTQYQYQKSDEKLSLEDKVKMIKSIINQKGKINITYLKANDEKSNRIVEPKKIGNMIFNNKQYLGMEAFCLIRNDYRVFRIERILKIQEQ